MNQDQGLAFLLPALVYFVTRIGIIGNDFGRLSQVGSFIHEGLRAIQAIDSGFSDEALQYVTARIVLTDPSPGETLDDSNCLGLSFGVKSQVPT